MGKIDRAALRQKIQQLEGLSDDERAALLELAATKRYGLVWEVREEAVEERLREELPVLVEDKELALTDGGKEAPNHILIEGDNLEALTTLSYTHEGKVDVIYIDPPYNTGNRDFVYNDSYVDSEDSYRHSKWLSFMSKRLRIAKRLLSDRGVVFISIDGNEQANLKLLCDLVFGEKNCLGCISVVNNLKGRSDDAFFATCHEYMLVYSKNRDTAAIAGFALEEEELDDDYDKQDSFGYYKLIGLRKTGTGWQRAQRPYMFYPILLKDGVFSTIPQSQFERIYTEATKSFDDEYLQSLVAGYESEGYRVFLPRTSNGEWGRWRWGRNTFERNRMTEIELNRTDTVCSKMRATLENGELRMKTAKTIWYKPEYDNGSSSAFVSSIFSTNNEVFSNPKSIHLIKDVLRIATCRFSTVLDFFAGSGTTLHAVMQLNKEDGGMRQCILVTNNENNICREVTYERNKRVICGYTTPKGTQVEGLHENNLRYYRTHLLPRERTNRNMRRLVAASTDLLCIKENIFDEIQVSGFKFQARDARLFSDGERAMMVIYNEEVIPEVVDWLQTAQATNALTHSRTNAIKVYVFSPGAYAWDDDFSPVIDRVELCALPEAIYQAYKSVLPKKKVRRETAEGSPKEGGEE